MLRADLLARLGRRQPTGTIIGFDCDIRYQSENYRFTLRVSYIHEHQRLGATFLNGESANLTNELNTLRLQTIFQHLGHAAYDPYSGLARGLGIRATARLPRLPIFRLPAGVAVIQRASAHNTFGTTSWMATPSTPATTTPCSSMLGRRCRTADR